MGFLIKTKNKVLLGLILVGGLILFTYKIGQIPSGVYVDEAVVGYDAYSILTTGKDHYGQSWPIYFRFFNSYTPGLFVYAAALAIRVWGLNIVALRLLSGWSMLVVAATLFWFLKKQKLLQQESAYFLAVIFFLITPWTVFNARLGYETTLAFALLAEGILVYENPTLSWGLISLSTYAGHTERYLAPIIIGIIYLVFYWRKVPLKKLLRPMISALVLQVPNFVLMFTPSFWVKNDSLTGAFVSQYLSYFSPANLFNRPDFDLQRSVPEMAVFYSWMFFPWVVGLGQLWKQRRDLRYRYLALLTLAMPLPAAMANVNYSTQRALPLLLPYTIIMAVGADHILGWMKKWFRWGLVITILLFSGVMLWRSYFILFPVERKKAWNAGYEEVGRLIGENPQRKFVVDNSRGMPGILVLYWLRYPPKLYQQENVFRGNYYHDLTFERQSKWENVEIRPINWKADTCEEVVLVGDDLAISEEQIKEHKLKQVLMIRDNRRQILVQAYGTNPEKKCNKL